MAAKDCCFPALVYNTRSSVVVGDEAKKFFFLRLWTWSTEWVPADQKGTIPLSSRREIRNLKKKKTL